MRIKRQSSTKKMPHALSWVLIVLCISAASFGVAILWQQYQTGLILPAPSSEVEIQSSVAQPESVSASSVASSSSVSSSSSSASESSSSESADNGDIPVREEYTYALPASKKVPSSYFDDAIFFGDSISTGIPLYQTMPGAKVVAFTGIHTGNILTKQAIEVEGVRVTLLDFATQYGDMKKVYILLGGNGLDFSEVDFIAGYREFLLAVKAKYPNAIIYLQSMTPVTTIAHETYPSVSNEKIDQYNLAIMNLAKEQSVNYLDIAAALVDENGQLPLEASPIDGMHFSPEYYSRWFEYLKTHTVEEKTNA